MFAFTVFAATAVLVRLFTLSISIRNERRLKASGGVELGRRTSSLLTLAHLAFYFLAISEGVARGAHLDGVAWVGIGLFACGVLGLFWVIRILGRFWTVKLILARDHELVEHWLFRAVRHPNYLLGILPELVGLALACHALTTLTFGLPVYAAILLLRVRQEEAAMRGRFKTY